MNKLDKFEELIKNSLEGYEMPYDAGEWTRFEQKLGGGATPKSGKGMWYVAAGAAAIVAISASIYFTNNQNNKQADLSNNNATVVKTDVKSIEDSNNNIYNNNTEVQVKTNETNTINKSVVTNTSETNRINEVANNNSTNVNESNSNNLNNVAINTNNTPNNTNSNNNNPVNSPDQISDAKPSISIDKTTVCAGEKITLKVENHSAKVDLGNGEIISLNLNEKKQISFNEAGVYTMHLADMPDVSQTITVLAKPEANITYNTTIEDGRQITKINTDSYLNSGIIWVFHDGKSTNEKSTWRYYNKKGTYPVKLILEGNNGCKNEISRQVIIEEDYNLLAPNIFSPNGDGINETFIPEALKILNVNFVMTVYDRSGKLVYTTNTVDKPWDGRYTTDNKLAPVGVYIWVVKMIDDRGNAETFKGDVRLD